MTTPEYEELKSRIDHLEKLMVKDRIRSITASMLAGDLPDRRSSEWIARDMQARLKAEGFIK